RFNAHNALAVLGLAHGWGLDLDAVSAALEAVPGVPGRMERVDAGQPFMVVVDYAHTSASLDAVLRELQPLARHGHVISVCGASGERDTGKRPLMGEAAAKRSRLVIITDRREAIAEAFRRAKPGEVVLLAGKGHETWNVGPNGPEPWSDRDAALRLLAA